jgi:DNA-binding MarR family transcriptional regulator
LFERRNTVSQQYLTYQLIAANLLPVPLTQEIRQSRPFASPAQEAVLGLLRTADVLRRFIGTVVEPRGITMQQYNVLRILRGAGERGLPTLDIAERMIEQTPGITRLIDRLETKSLVTRQRCETDRRQVFCRITPAGLELLARLDALVVTAGDEAMSALTAPDLTRLIKLLDRTRDRVHQQFASSERKPKGNKP